LQSKKSDKNHNESTLTHYKVQKEESLHTMGIYSDLKETHWALKKYNGHSQGRRPAPNNCMHKF